MDYPRAGYPGELCSKVVDEGMKEAAYSGWSSRSSIPNERSEYAMGEDKVIRLKSPGTPGAVEDPLTEVLREGARRLLVSAIEAEVESFLEQFREEKTTEGLNRMVRNGRLPSRTIQTGIGDIEVSVPRVRDRAGRSASARRFCRRTSGGRRRWRGCCPGCILKGISDGRVSGSLDGAVGQGRAGLVGQYDQPLERGVEGRASALVAV
ncbi:transposase (plasmid) [Candidatus Methylocalor cossyra]|uniref:Transposase n=1 Tax=Candidatus Methylocalor cossyra TaxID=3108543 RepID=A0ABM9NN45_9GAMM